MSWFRLDDQGAFHAKVVQAGNEAYGAWCRAGQWSCAQLTEGRVTRATALAIAPMRVWKKLIAARGTSEHGLVEEIGEDFQIHDFLDWNPTAADELAKRAARSAAGKTGGQKSAATRAARFQANPQANGQANAQAIASAVAEANGKQNSTPSPSPSPIPERSDPPMPPEGLVLVPSAASEVRRKDPVEQVFERYLAVRARYRPGVRAPRLKPKERARASKLLALKYTPEDLDFACEGLFLSPHHLGNNDRGTEYLEFFHALGENVVDSFIEAGGRARERRAPATLPAPAQPEPEYAPPTPEEAAALTAKLQNLVNGPRSSAVSSVVRAGDDLSPAEIERLETRRVAQLRALREASADDVAPIAQGGRS